MIVICSPSKQMRVCKELHAKRIPDFQDTSKKIVDTLKTLSLQDIQKLMKVNEKIASENLERYQKITFDLYGTPAFMAYQGLQFKYMDIASFDDAQWVYVENHIRMISGLYGVLHPFDSIYPYRLEMQCKLTVGDKTDLYALWSKRLADYLIRSAGEDKNSAILNLASKEYAKAVVPYLKVHVVTCTFLIMKNNGFKSESTQVKIARGQMVKFLVQQGITHIEDVKRFQENGYSYDEGRSDDHEYVFIKYAEDNKS